MLGTVLAFTLNLLFRIWVRRRVHLQFDVASGKAGDLDDFLDEHGTKWGARRDIVARASFSLHQFAKAIGDHCNVRAPIRIEASFDEFNLDLVMSREGVPLELLERRPRPGNRRMGCAASPDSCSGRTPTSRSRRSWTRRPW